MHSLLSPTKGYFMLPHKSVGDNSINFGPRQKACGMVS